MKISGWVYSSLDINHGQHSYKGTVEKKKVKVQIDLGMHQVKIKGRTDGVCVVKLPHVQKPEKGLKEKNPEYYKRLIDEAKLFKDSYKQIIKESFAAIKKAAQEKGRKVESMRLKIEK